MSGGSSSVVEWFTHFESSEPTRELVHRPDDMRLGEATEFWRGDLNALESGRPVLLGFPQDEGVLRNQGRPGAALAPREIRRWLARLTPWDAEQDIDLAARAPLDAGDLRMDGRLEDTQQTLATVIAALLQRGTIPIVLGGGHETAYGHFLGYATGQRRVGIVNIDAHLDVRPRVDGRGHSGSVFRQALEHFPPPSYVCLGAQPHAVSRSHCEFARNRGCVVYWRDQLHPSLEACFASECTRLADAGCQVYVTIDADAVQTADVPGVSSPNPTGLSGGDVIRCARWAGRCPAVASLDVVEVNPEHDRDSQSARWAALVVWNFLAGLARRPR